VSCYCVKTLICRVVNHYTKLLSTIVSGVGFTFNHLRPIKTTGATASSLSFSMVLLSFSLQLNIYK
jgi:hypothetical protein